ncbi:hypothetical protein CspeluHIS016_0500080 [Cutaneotrichosporon spelunceum]|uniref:3-hydroxyisobutyrate dehydrogenase n=1 Tax=Cutaneotrichosporon spelunceum TaxID=1672016 RepID=A0AAD3TWP2_9TREE|nr:hypothetical protein CspeluHIS016_0500080 [Cutaneotrichosporon spelunceum]
MVSQIDTCPRSSTIGFIGLGAMGGPMAVNIYTKAWKAAQDYIAQGKQSTIPRMAICELSDKNADLFMDTIRIQIGEEAASRITRVDSPRELSECASRIVTVLPATKHVEEVYLGENGLIAGLDAADKSMTLAKANNSSPWWLAAAHGEIPEETTGAHTLFVDSTTLDPVAAKRVADIVHERTRNRALMADGPVSGATAGASAGTLTVMLGATDKFTAANATALMQFCSREGGVVYCGGNGAGIGLKVCNNLILSINQIALAEGLALGKALNLDPIILNDVFNTSSAQSWSSSKYSPLPQIEGGRGILDYEGFAVANMIKDVTLGLSVAETVGLPTAMLSTAKKVYDDVVAYDNGRLAGKDFSVTYKWLNELQAKNVAAKASHP